MRTLAVLMALSASDAVRLQPRLLALRGGGAKAAKPPDVSLDLSTIKVNPEWSGSVVDAALGGGIGFLCGVTVGSTVKLGATSTVGLSAFLVSQCSFAFALSRLAANLGIITIHWERIGFFGWKLFRILDADRDGKLTQADLSLGIGRILPGALRQHIFSSMDVDGDGKITSKDAELLSKANQHAGAGGAAGFAVGLAKGLGLA